MEIEQKKPFVYMERFILFVLLILFGLVLTFQFSFVIYIIFKLCYLADTFIQSDLQIEDNRTNQNQRAIIYSYYSVKFQLHKETFSILS